MSRKARLNEEPTLTVEFAKLLRSGASREEACQRLNVPLQCFKDWMRWGSLCSEHGSIAKEPYRTFARTVGAALRDFEGSLVDEILRQGADARYAHDVFGPGKDGPDTLLHKRGEIMVNPKGYVARPGRWEANRWLLQVRFPKTYAPQVRVVIEQHHTTVLRALERGLEPEVFARVLEIMAKADEGDELAELGPFGPGPAPAPPAAGKSTTH
jgi:hypothetical protein